MPSTLLRASLVFPDLGHRQGWDPSLHPRYLADLTGRDGNDVIGFGQRAVLTALNRGDGTFGDTIEGLRDFSHANGWRTDMHERLVGDVTGDGRADIVGFGHRGVLVATSRGDGTFQMKGLVLPDMGFEDGWRPERHPRVLARLRAVGREDIVGFGHQGVVVALSSGDGQFASPRIAVSDFGFAQGWRKDRHPRFVADVTGDGVGDLVGFGERQVFVAIGRGDGSFGPVRSVLSDFVAGEGWDGDQHPRFLADTTGDGRADIVGFGTSAVLVATSRGDGTFDPPRAVVRDFGKAQGWNPSDHVRLASDVTGGGRADIVGFGHRGVIVALNEGGGTFGSAQLVCDDFGTNDGWSTTDHVRTVADLNGDGMGDLVGFGHGGVSVSLAGVGAQFSPVAGLSEIVTTSLQCAAILELEGKGRQVTNFTTTAVFDPTSATVRIGPMRDIVIDKEQTTTKITRIEFRDGLYSYSTGRVEITLRCHVDIEVKGTLGALGEEDDVDASLSTERQFTISGTTFSGWRFGNDDQRSFRLVGSGKLDGSRYVLAIICTPSDSFVIAPKP